ncbi:MAG: S8 family serine peptidase, partial [Proteobacteria bacterium]|nr:S8 family serine peptidase [Pseudomonadota bacterium]
MATEATSRDLDEDRILVTLHADNPLGTVALSPSGRLGYHTASAGDIRAGFVRTAQQLASAHDLHLEEDWPIPSLQVHCFVFRVADLRERRHVVAQLREHPEVESVQALQFFHGEGSGDPDPLVGWNAELDAGLQMAHRNSTGKSVSIAVIDAGIDTAHEDLEGSELDVIDLVDGRQDVPAEAHGTAVVGLIAARPENGVGIRGYAPGSRISLMRACWEPGTTRESAVCNSFTLAKALSLVLESDADIVNLSISGPRDPLLERLAAEIVSRGQILVAAGTGTETFPGSVPGSVLAVRL